MKLRDAENGRVFFTKLAAAFFLFVFLSLTVLPKPAVAHSPSGMILGYDAEDGILSVDISHQVVNPNNHYVSRVEIRKNGVLYHEQDYSMQPTDSTFEYTYNLAAEDGDIIEVFAVCNVSGSISKSIEISGSLEPVPIGAATPISWPTHAAPMILGFVLLLTGALVARYMKKKAGWLKVHKVFQILGSVSALAGVSLGFYMVSITTGQHFRVPHAYVATVTIILILTNLVLGYLQFREGSNLLVAHRWLGRIVIMLLLINIIFGLSLVGIL